MKKTFYIIAASALTLASCSSKPNYQIQGTCQDIADGTKIYLTDYKGDKAQNIDSAIIEKGKFTIEGRVEKAHACQLVTADKKMAVDLILEPEDIFVEMGATPMETNVSGTEQNDKLYEYTKNILNFNKDFNERYRVVYMDKELTDEMKQEKLDELQKEADNKKDEFFNLCKAEIMTPVGIKLFTMLNSWFNEEQNEELLEMIPAEDKQDGTIKAIADYFNKKKHVAVGKKFIDFEQKTPEGENVKLSSLIAGKKYVIIDFWASWCGPCRREMPTLVKAYKEFKDKGFEIVGVSLDKEADAWKSAIEKLDITWPQMSDLKGWQNEAAQTYCVRGIPHTVLLNSEGVIIEKDLRGEELLEKLAELMK